MHPATDHDNLFTAWWRDHCSIFLQVARSFAPTPADEADLVQEMLVQLWRSLPRFRAQCKPSTWIYRVCLNTALTWRRDESRRLPRAAAAEAAIETACARPPPGAQHERDEQLAALYAAIRQLPPAERSLVLLLLDGLSYREIGEIAGLTENHVGVSLTRARKKLAESMQEVRHEL
jgi:RNA polymerase sigma-70 factor (ECF subfamily)